MRGTEDALRELRRDREEKYPDRDPEPRVIESTYVIEVDQSPSPADKPDGARPVLGPQGGVDPTVDRAVARLENEDRKEDGPEEPVPSLPSVPPEVPALPKPNPHGLWSRGHFHVPILVPCKNPTWWRNSSWLAFGLLVALRRMKLASLALHLNPTMIGIYARFLRWLCLTVENVLRPKIPLSGNPTVEMTHARMSHIIEGLRRPLTCDRVVASGIMSCLNFAGFIGQASLSFVCRHVGVAATWVERCCGISENIEVGSHECRLRMALRPDAEVRTLSDEATKPSKQLPVLAVYQTNEYFSPRTHVRLACENTLECVSSSSLSKSVSICRENVARWIGNQSTLQLPSSVKDLCVMGTSELLMTLRRTYQFDLDHRDQMEDFHLPPMASHGLMVIGSAMWFFLSPMFNLAFQSFVMLLMNEALDLSKRRLAQFYGVLLHRWRM